jgi:saxitoxin biosynthesis operon SxtJ-like protein
VIAAALAVVAIRGMMKHWSFTTCLTCLIAGIVFGLLALMMPRVLAPLNRAWFYLGKAMGKVVSPIVLAIMFYGILAPVAMVTRWFGRDALRLKRGTVRSYWIDRDSPDLPPDSFKNQF